MRIGLIGGHGKIAMLLAPMLVEAGHAVDSVIRNPEHSDEVEATGAQAVVRDVETLDNAAMQALVRGYDAVIWAAGAGGGNPQRTYAVDRDAAIRSMDAAEKVGVTRYVMVSYFGASTRHGVSEDNAFFPYAEAKGAADEHLRESALDWTIVAPSRLTNEEASGSIEVASERVSGAEVSRGNVAQVIAAAVDRPDLHGVMVQFNDGSTPIRAALDELAH